MTKTIKFAVLLTLLSAITTQAAPANPHPQEVKQADGSTVTIAGRGDENFNWTEDLEGHIVAYNRKTKNWHYAYLAGKEILPGSEVLGKPATKSFSAQKSAPPSRITAADLALPVQQQSEQEIFNAPLSNMNPALLPILIEYNDVSIIKSMDYWNRLFFGGSQGQLNHYFNEISGGKFQYRNLSFSGSGNSSVEFFGGIAKVKLNKNHPGDNKTAIEADIKTAFDAVKGFINFRPFESNLHNGNITNEDFAVYGVFAGKEASNQRDEPQSIWAHARTLRSDGKMRAVRYSDLELFSYAVQGEIYSGEGATAIALGVGVTAHELGHLLGLPDLYDTSSESEGVGPYSLMGNGCWGAGNGEAGGYRPTHLDAWSKITLGFVEATEVTTYEDWRGDIRSIAASGDYNVLKITSTADANQYFLVENRGLTGYDAGFYRYGIREENNNGGGILIYHIDESVTDYWGRLSNANWRRRGVAVEPADGSNILDNRIRYANDYRFYDHFFSNSAYNAFDSSTVPNSDFYNNKASGISIKINSNRAVAMEVDVKVTGVKYTVNFDLNNGRGNEPESIIGVQHGSRLSEAQMPATAEFTRVAHTHDGKWYTRTGRAPNYVYTEFLFGANGTPVAGNITLYLKWTIVPYTGDVPYIDENGDLQTIDISNVTEINAENIGTINNLNGWYIVRGILQHTRSLGVLGEAHIILENGSDLTITGRSDYAGVNVSENNILAIYAQSKDDYMGRLTATGGNYAAGIGGNEEDDGGTIIINGGIVTATGGRDGAGIGGGCGNGWTGIGGGTGNITINGGTVTANGGSNGAGIGSGDYGSSGGTITINGGTVTANGGSSGAGIGGSSNASGGIINISGGTITANGGSNGAGIGGGWYSGGGTIVISGGIVTATSGSRSAGIGSGYGGIHSSDPGTFTLNGNAIVFASSISDAAESRKTSGILFIANEGKVYGNTTIENDFEIPEHHTLTIPAGIILTNKATITPANYSTVIVDGTIAANKILGANVISPIASEITKTSISIDAPLLANTGQEVEYGIANEKDLLPLLWQTEMTFEDLIPGIYYIFVRSKENLHFASGTVPIVLQISTISGGTPIFSNPENRIIGSIGVQTTGNTIILQNVPQGAKVEVYNLKGERLASGQWLAANGKMQIETQAKGVYVVRVGNQALKVPVR
ncbi:MAG: M6 family metalloprotease domain-containing protein [Fibromonadaceae bacterium]|jgi:M6 family metalloprotease-like protein|nr:M6 family metalloprotease domain-containing protein [Fibromonadaceae bacterium]